MGGVRTLKWEGFRHWGGGGGRFWTSEREGLDIREGRGLHFEGGRGYPRTIECF